MTYANRGVWRVLTAKQVDGLHAAIDRATIALGDLGDAQITRNEVAAKAAIDKITDALAEAKEGLRGSGVDETEAREGGGMTDREMDRQNKLLEHAAEARGKGQESMVTVASGALALSVTFREALVQSSPVAPWLLKLLWVAFALCVVLVIVERFTTSVRMTIHAVGRTNPGNAEKWLMGAPHLLSMLAFAVGIVALALFGLVNL